MAQGMKSKQLVKLGLTQFVYRIAITPDHLMFVAPKTSHKHASILSNMSSSPCASSLPKHAVMSESSPDAFLVVCVLQTCKIWLHGVDYGQDAVGELGNRPIHLAAASGHTAIVKLLLRHGANVVCQSPPGLPVQALRGFCGSILFLHASADVCSSLADGAKGLLCVMGFVRCLRAQAS